MIVLMRIEHDIKLDAMIGERRDVLCNENIRNKGIGIWLWEVVVVSAKY